MLAQITVYREFFASGNFGENDVFKVSYIRYSRALNEDV